MNSLGKRRTYMDFWNFSPEQKEKLIEKLVITLPALRGATKATQEQVAMQSEFQGTLIELLSCRNKKYRGIPTCHLFYSLITIPVLMM